MYRTGKENFLTIPPTKSDRGNDFQTVTSLLLFTRMTFFQTYHPKNKRFLTDFTRILKNLGEKNSFSENLTV